MVNCLDCESTESTVASVCKILSLSRRELDDHVNEFARNPFEIHNNEEADVWLPMLSGVAGKDIADQILGETMWFHATRVQDFLTFRRGLLTVREQLEHTWQFLRTLVADLVSDAQWKDFRIGVEEDNYGLLPEVWKAWQADGGPWAFLLA